MVLILYIILVGIFASVLVIITKITIMKEKIDIAAILKDCPKGMELNCTLAYNVVFDKIIEYDRIQCVIGECKEPLILDKYGRLLLSNSKCVIFPKGKTTWEGFQRPFKDGDVAISDRGGIHLLRTKDSSYCAYRDYWKVSNKFDKTITTNVKIVRLATKDERQKLFDVIKENGYEWNSETKTLEKLIVPKFKVGDKVKHKTLDIIYTIKEVATTLYHTDKQSIFFKHQDNWDIIEKFNIATLKPFKSNVLIRDSECDLWEGDIFVRYNNDNKFRFICLSGNVWKQCIPYEGNEHLLGTNNSCTDYYKNW